MNTHLIFGDNDNHINIVGQKAYNLAKYKLITPEFIVLSVDSFKEWKNNKHSFYPQRLHRVDIQCFTSRQVTGKERDHHDEYGN